MLVCNEPNRDLFRLCRELHPTAANILLTDKTLNDFQPGVFDWDIALVDHIIANRSPSIWTIHEFRTTIQKIVCNDIFGIEKYLFPGTKIFREVVTGSACREGYNHQIQKFVEDSRLSSHLAKTAFGICEELLMNAVYDAPVSRGVHKHHGVSRTVQVDLEPEERGGLEYGWDDQILAIGVHDPFGSLEKSVFFKYLQKIRFRDDSNILIDKKAGGAGLGLFKILFGAHSLICNVEKGKRTEVIAVIETRVPVRDFSIMPRSMQFFESVSAAPKSEGS